MENHYDYLIKNEEVFLNFLREKYPVVNKSNLFLRDLEYGIKHFFELKGEKMDYEKISKVAKNLISKLEKENKLELVFKNTWKVNLIGKDDVINSETSNTNDVTLSDNKVKQ